MTKPIRCNKVHDICPICEQCEKHCVGHVSMLAPIVLLNTVKERVDRDILCKALLNWKKLKGGDRLLVQVGRVDTAITREAEDDAAKASKRRKAA